MTFVSEMEHFTINGGEGKKIYIIHFLLFRKRAWKKYPTLSGHRVFGVPSGLVGPVTELVSPREHPKKGLILLCAVVVVDISFAVLRVPGTKKSPLNREKSGVKVFPCG